MRFVLPMSALVPVAPVFNSYELAGFIGDSLVAMLISVDGESYWLEGAQLLALYLMHGISFYFVS
jgi:Ca2+:H+ antiporter